MKERGRGGDKKRGGKVCTLKEEREEERRGRAEGGRFYPVITRGRKGGETVSKTGKRERKVIFKSV